MSELALPTDLAPAADAQTVRLPDLKARSFFRRSTIQTRLAAAFLILGALSFVGTATAIWKLDQVQERGRADLRAGHLAGELHAAVAGNVVRATALAAARDPVVPELLARGFQSTEQRIEQLHAELSQLARSSGSHAVLADAASNHEAFRQAYRAALQGRSRGDDVPALSAGPLPAAIEAHVRSTQAVLDFHAGEAATSLQEHARAASRDLLILFLVLSILCLPPIVALFVHILRPMYGAVRIARRVADGDLTVQVRTGGNDEMARVMLALDDMTRTLRRIVGDVVRSAGAVSATGARVREGQMELSQRTEAQASTLQQTASSMEELTATVAQSADTARQASELAAGAAQVAVEGGDVVGRVVDSMNGISASARKIGEISGVIDGIAFQTNILALNAAVEAARAGDQGRGFAVVAAEVRTLAQRSATAAREIKGLIGESVHKVESGAALVDGAGHKMEEIVASVRKVSDLISGIAAASEQQKAGIEQVNAAIAQMDQGVQQNAALVDKASQSTGELQSQSAALLRSVAQFKITQETDVEWTAPAGRIGMGNPR